MWQPSKLTPEQIEERRLEGGRLLKRRPPVQSRIARRLGVSGSAVSQWAQQLKQRRRGLKGLQRNKPAGASPRLTPAQWRKMLRDLQRGAPAFR